MRKTDLLGKVFARTLLENELGDNAAFSALVDVRDLLTVWQVKEREEEGESESEKQRFKKDFFFFFWTRGRRTNRGMASMVSSCFPCQVRNM